MNLFIAIVRYRKPLAEVDRMLEAHRAFLTAHYATGDIAMSGPQMPREGGIIIYRGENRRDVETIMRQDPFYVHGIAEYELIGFTPTKFLNDTMHDILLTPKDPS